MVADRVDMKTAQTRVGHSDPRLTLAVYAQAMSDSDRSAADRLGDRFMAPSRGVSRGWRLSAIAVRAPAQRVAWTNVGRGAGI